MNHRVVGWGWQGREGGAGSAETEQRLSPGRSPRGSHAWLQAERAFHFAPLISSQTRRLWDLNSDSRYTHRSSGQHLEHPVRLSPGGQVYRGGRGWPRSEPVWTNAPRQPGCQTQSWAPLGSPLRAHVAGRHCLPRLMSSSASQQAEAPSPRCQRKHWTLLHAG